MNNTSLAISNCQVPGAFREHAYIPFGNDVEPRCTSTQTHITPLNQMGIELVWDQYRPVNCQGQPAYQGTNPKLMDAVRGQPLFLDRPHFTGALPVGNVEHDQIYTKDIDKYGGVYKNYEAMRGGSIQYYVDSTTADAYVSPNYTQPRPVNKQLFQDPMGVVKPMYFRQEECDQSWNTCRPEPNSSTFDTLLYRQDLMERQSRVRNQQKWSARWG